MTREKRISAILAVLCAAIFLALFLSMLVLNLFTPLIADDYVYAMRDAYGEQKMSFSGFLRMQYFALNGRVLLHSLLVGALLLPRFLFAALNAAVYCSLIYLLAKHSKTSRDPVFILSGVILCWFCIPVFGQTVLWTSGAVNYLWGTVLILWFLLPYGNSVSSGHIPGGKALAVRCAVLGLLAGATNENTAGAAILFCVLTLGVTLLRNKGRPGRVPVWMIAGLAGALAGFCVMVSAPANFVRLDNVGSVSFLFRFSEVAWAARRLYFMPALIYAVLLTLSAFLYKKEALQKSLLSIIFAVCGCAAGAVMILPSLAPARAYFGGVVFLLAAILIQGRILLAGLSKTSLPLLPALFLATAAFVISITPAAFHLRTIKHHHDARDTYIREQVSLGERDLTVVRLHPRTPLSGLSTLGDVSADPSVWRNQAIANYYGLDSIRSGSAADLP